MIGINFLNFKSALLLTKHNYWKNTEIKQRKILSCHFYDMVNKMAQNEGVCLSNGWMKALLWIFLPCFIYTVSSIVYYVVSSMEK